MILDVFKLVYEFFVNGKIKAGLATMVTTEPLLKFDLEKMLEYINRCQPKKVNIGRNSCRSIELPEPTKEEVKQLIYELKDMTRVEVKKNAKLWLE